MIGAAARYLIGVAWPTPIGAFPWATLTINVTGCAVIRMLMVRPDLHRARRFTGLRSRSCRSSRAGSTPRSFPRAVSARLCALARRSAIPVELDVSMDARLPEPIEVAGYYVASETVANATKHAQASRIVSLPTHHGSRLLSIRDDGVGGADATRGSGLVGLTDRVEVLGGLVRVYSRPGDGTHIIAELPLEFEWAKDAD